MPYTLEEWGNNYNILSHDWVGELWVSSADTTELITGLRSHQWIPGHPEDGQGGLTSEARGQMIWPTCPKIVQSQ